MNLKSLGSIEREVIQAIVHPDYEAPKVYFDVALIILDKVQYRKKNVAFKMLKHPLHGDLDKNE